MPTILIIEDNKDILDNAVEILELELHKVLIAYDGKTGVALALEKKPDLILCDIVMPDINGYEVLKTIRQVSYLNNTPFIFLTAMAEKNDIYKGIELGADGYIIKPFEMDAFIKVIQSKLSDSITK